MVKRFHGRAEAKRRLAASLTTGVSVKWELTPWAPRQHVSAQEKARRKCRAFQALIWIGTPSGRRVMGARQKLGN